MGVRARQGPHAHTTQIHALHAVTRGAVSITQQSSVHRACTSWTLLRACRRRAPRGPWRRAVRVSVRDGTHVARRPRWPRCWEQLPDRSCLRAARRSFFRPGRWRRSSNRQRRWTQLPPCARLRAVQAHARPARRTTRNRRPPPIPAPVCATAAQAPRECRQTRTPALQWRHIQQPQRQQFHQPVAARRHPAAARATATMTIIGTPQLPQAAHGTPGAREQRRRRMQS
jgi:hypothetical protein